MKKASWEKQVGVINIWCGGLRKGFAQITVHRDTEEYDYIKQQFIAAVIGMPVLAVEVK